MLVLSRRVSEKIVLPSLGVTVEVLEVLGKKVRLGISAPDSVRITRQELLTDRAAQPDHVTDSSDSQFELPQMTGI